MTQPVTEGVTPPVVKEAPEGIAENVDDHTPETPPQPEHTDSGIDELREVVAKLATSVASLTDLVTKGTDEKVSKVPWTHRGGTPKVIE